MSVEGGFFGGGSCKDGFRNLKLVWELRLLRPWGVRGMNTGGCWRRFSGGGDGGWFKVNREANFWEAGGLGNFPSGEAS